MSRGRVAPPRRADVSPPDGGTRNAGGFTRWEDHDSYREAFDRLPRDLRAGA